MIIDHDHPAYRNKWQKSGFNRFNGAFYYSKEIVKNIIPNVKTDRNWITINIPEHGCNHAIVFIHNNLHPENYDWLARFNDLILVCGIPETVEKVAHLGKAIYLPLSIDVENVMQYKRPKTKKAAFVGRKAKRKGIDLPPVDCIEGLPRTKLLAMLAEYEEVYAVGRCALEAKALGCRILPYDPRFPDPERWEVLDNREAAKILQKKIDEIDIGGKRNNVTRQSNTARERAQEAVPESKSKRRDVQEPRIMRLVPGKSPLQREKTARPDELP